MSTPHPAVHSQPAEAHLPDYVAVFSDEAPPKDYQFTEYPFTALSDAHAEELMQREYPSSRWTLYRIDPGGQRREVRFYFEEK